MIAKNMAMFKEWKAYIKMKIIFVLGWWDYDCFFRNLMLLCWFYEKTALGDMISCSSLFDVYLAVLLPYTVSKSQLSTLPLCMASLLANGANIYAGIVANI